MVGTILSAVRGPTRRAKGVLLVHISAYILGAVLVGVAVGVLGLFLRMFVGDVQPQWVLAISGCASVLFSMNDLDLINLSGGEKRWQVPARWRAQLSDWCMSFCYGVVLGMGAFTRNPTGAFSVMVILVMVEADPWTGGLVASGFGFGRAMSVLMTERIVKDRLAVDWVLETLPRSAVLLRTFTGMILGLCGSLFLGLATRR